MKSSTRRPTDLFRLAVIPSLLWGALGCAGDGDPADIPPDDDDHLANDDDQAVCEDCVDPESLVGNVYAIDCLFCGTFESHLLEEAMWANQRREGAQTMAWTVTGVDQEGRLLLDTAILANVESQPPSSYRHYGAALAQLDADRRITIHMDRGFVLWMDEIALAFDEGSFTGTVGADGKAITGIDFEGVYDPPSFEWGDYCQQSPTLCNEEGKVEIGIHNLTARRIDPAEIKLPIPPEIIQPTGYELSCVWRADIVEPKGLGPVLSSVIDRCGTYPTLGWSVAPISANAQTLRLATLELDPFGNFRADSAYRMGFKPIDFAANPYFKAYLDGPVGVPEGDFEFIEAYYQGEFSPDFRSIENLIFQGTLDTGALFDLLGSDPCGLIPDICAEDGMIHLRLEGLTTSPDDDVIPPPVRLVDIRQGIYRTDCDLGWRIPSLPPHFDILDPCEDFIPGIEFRIQEEGTQPHSLEMRVGISVPPDLYDSAQTEWTSIDAADFRSNPYFRAEWSEMTSEAGPWPTLALEEAWVVGRFEEDGSGIDEITLQMEIDASYFEATLGTDPCQLSPDFCTPGGTIISRVEEMRAVRVEE